jgi:hypothetical protein
MKQWTKSFVRFLVFCVALMLALVGKLQAQDDKDSNVIELEEMVVEGRVQKPNAFYILNRSNLGYEVFDLKTSFVQEIVKSVEEDEF